MIAGVPGIGISGIFYLACAFLMPFIEIVQTIKGKSSLKRWKLVGLQFSLFSGIMAASFLTGLLLVKMINQLMTLFSHVSHGNFIQTSNFFRISPILLSLMIMAILFTSIHLWNKHRERRYKTQLNSQDL